MTSTLANTPAAWSARALTPDPYQAVGWSQQSQLQRFMAVSRHLRLHAGETLLDFGSGTGAFCPWVSGIVDYYAYDWAPGMRERCATEHGSAIVLDELPEMLFDHVVCVGPFNLPGNWSTDRTWETLAELWTMSTRKTLIVCLYRGSDPRCLRYTPEEAARFAQALCSNRYVIDAGYLDNDFLLEMRR